MKQDTFNKALKQVLRMQEYKENKNRQFTKAMQDKLIELVYCQYKWGVDYPTSTNPQEQKMLKDLYAILTYGGDVDNE